MYNKDNMRIIITRMPRKRADGHHRQHARLCQLSEVQKPRDLDLDLGSGQGHMNIRSICRTTSVRNHVTVASPSTEICRHLNVVKYRHSVKYEL